MILAKKSYPDRGEPVTLLRHTRDVLDSARELFGVSSSTRLAKRWLAFFGLAESAWNEFQRRCLHLA